MIVGNSNSINACLKNNPVKPFVTSYRNHKSDNINKYNIIIRFFRKKRAQ